VNKIECKGAIPQGRSAHTAVIYNNDIYVFGGWNGGASNNEFFRYNIGTYFNHYFQPYLYLYMRMYFNFKISLLWVNQKGGV